MIYGKTEEEHLNHIRMVLDLLRKHMLYGKLSKCEFMKDSTEYLGHIVTRDGIKVNPKKVFSAHSPCFPLFCFPFFIAAATEILYGKLLNL